MSGVLADSAIAERVQRGELIVGGTFSEESLQPASYDLTVASDGLIAPDGEVVEPGSGHRRRRQILLRAGETALFTSREYFSMPDDVAGNITIRNTLATQGLTLLSGMLIDPGFGRTAAEPGREGSPLYLHVANIGRESIAISPGHDTLARVQFLEVIGEPGPNRKEVGPSLWADQQQASLGFLSELRDLKENVERSDTRSQQVVMFGFVVLATALIGASFSTILSIETNSELRTELRHAWPSSSSDLILWAGIFVGVSVFCLTAVLALRGAMSGIRARRSRRRRNRRR